MLQQGIVPVLHSEQSDHSIGSTQWQNFRKLPKIRHRQGTILVCGEGLLAAAHLMTQGEARHSVSVVALKLTSRQYSHLDNACHCHRTYFLAFHSDENKNAST
jgi:hypothetical protein